MNRLIALTCALVALSFTLSTRIPARQMPAPPPPVTNELMASMAGKWTATGDMNGMKYVDNVTSRWGINHQFLITDVRSTGMTGPKKTYFEGHGLLRYDPEKKQYVMHWFDSYGSMQIFMGEANDNVLTMTCKGEPRTETLTFTLGKGSYKLSMDASEGNNPPKREFETTYKKVKAAAAAPAAAAGETKPKS